jgi:anti-sigma-K factor RskA
MYDDDQDALAAEYVLGTLGSDERDQAKALLAIDAGFAAVVRAWERRLGELNVMVEAVEPPAKTWDRIRAAISGVEPTEDVQLPVIEDTRETSVAASASVAAAFPSFAPMPEPAAPPSPMSAAPVQTPTYTSQPSILPPQSAEIRIERSADVIYLARRVKRWRRMTLLMTTIAACLALFVAAAQYAPNLLPAPWRMPKLFEVAKAPTPAQTAGPLVAVLQQEPGAPAFLLSVDLQRRMLTVRRVSAPKEANRNYELWLVSKTFPQPRSLGVVGIDEFTQRPLPANYDPDTVNAATYAVSLEPAGGSPSGVPTGPVLFKGNLFQSVPAPAPAPQPK